MAFFNVHVFVSYNAHCRSRPTLTRKESSCDQANFVTVSPWPFNIAISAYVSVLKMRMTALAGVAALQELAMY